MPYFVYVSVAGENKISIYTMNRETGKLDEQGEVAAEGGPTPMTASPEEKYVYVGMRQARQIHSFRIDHQTGGLSLVSTCTLDADPVYLSTDRKGRYLLSSYYRAGVVAVHRIGDNGAVYPPPVEWRGTSERAHSIQTDPSNRFAFVPHVVPSNAIYQFRFDEQTGKLSPSAAGPVTPPVEEGPRHFCFHPSRDIVYVANEQGGSVTCYNFNAATGTLEEFQRVSTLPQGFEGSNACADIRITPDGDSVYASNRGHDSIACFAVDESSGELSAMGHVRTEETPRSIALDPAGEYLLVAGQGSGKLASYHVEESGALTPLETVDVGAAPGWVMVLNLVG
ncbi:lactonase family protein [Candidatus Latescibacterota bacterium]